MQYRQPGASPLKVSALCLGTMMFGDQTDARVIGGIDKVDAIVARMGDDFAGSFGIGLIAKHHGAQTQR